MKHERRSDGTFKPGSGGRPQGIRNRLHGDFIAALAADFEEHGAGVIRVVRMEKQVEYLKIVASILPKEFIVTDEALDQMTDEEIVEALALIRSKADDKDAPEQEVKH